MNTDYVVEDRLWRNGVEIVSHVDHGQIAKVRVALGTVVGKNYPRLGQAPVGRPPQLRLISNGSVQLTGEDEGALARRRRGMNRLLQAIGLAVPDSEPKRQTRVPLRELRHRTSQRFVPIPLGVLTLHGENNIVVAADLTGSAASQQAGGQPTTLSDRGR